MGNVLPSPVPPTACECVQPQSSQPRSISRRSDSRTRTQFAVFSGGCVGRLPRPLRFGHAIGDSLLTFSHCARYRFIEEPPQQGTPAQTKFTIWAAKVNQSIFMACLLQSNPKTDLQKLRSSTRQSSRIAVDSTIASPTNKVRVIVLDSSGCWAIEASACATAFPSPMAGAIDPTANGECGANESTRRQQLLSYPCDASFE